MNEIKALHLLDESPQGIYAVDADQKIIYWNPAAERILGYRSEEVMGLRCYEVCASLAENETSPICIEGCPSLALASRGVTPPVTHVRMLCSSGERKPVTVVPLIAQSEYEDDDTLVVHIFHDQINDAGAEKMAGERPKPD